VEYNLKQLKEALQFLTSDIFDDSKVLNSSTIIYEK